MSNNPWMHVITDSIKHVILENEKKNRTIEKAGRHAVETIKGMLPKAARCRVPQALPDDGNGEALVMPTYRQLNGYNCGLIAAYSLIGCFHPEWTGHAKLAAEIDTGSEKGTRTNELLRQLKKHGVGTTKARGELTMAKIVATIAEGYPILTSAVHLDENTTHWVVIYGYTADHEYVYVSNPSRRFLNQKIRWKDFERNLVPSDHPHAAFWKCHGISARKRRK